ncbi:MAG: TonB-dependent receptor, partial [Acidobacteria bacterium]|nr:TonB-dependent receptor [Acidobacteriota bacterium]
LAQVTTGTIMGTVSDSTGAVIPGSSVTIRNVETGIIRTATTGAAGRYRVPQLGLGNYEITAESQGFQKSVRTGVTLTVGREATVDFSLQVGAVTEQVTVTGEAPLIETTNATVAALVDQQAMRDLPLLGRSYADLTAIQPGVISNMEITATGNVAVYSGGGSATRRSIGGTRPSQSTYLLDGFESSTPSSGMPANSVLGEQLGVDAIREFSLLQSNFGAQFGRAAGGVVNAVTQSGTNDFHGTVFEFFRNEKMDAKGFFLDPRFSKPPYKRNQFGASLGGPIVKDRAFFFVNYEGVQVRAAETDVGSTITPEAWTGNITGCPTGLSRCSQAQAIVTKKVTVNKDILEVWKPLLPLPNGDYLANGVGDFTSTPRWTANENYGIGRVDYQLSENDSLFGRITKDRSFRVDHLTLKTPEPFTGFQVGGYILAALSETHVFSPTVINTARVGFTRRNDHLFYNYSDGGDQFPEGPGLDPRLSPVRGVPLGLYSLPSVSIYRNPGPSLSGPAVFVDNMMEYSDTVMISKGRHSIQVGGEFKRYQTNAKNEPWVYGGSFTWPNITDFLTNNPRNTTQLLGFHALPNQMADVYRGWRQRYGSLFFQDDFQLWPGLTVNLGVRWEGFNAPREVNGKLAILEDVYTSADFTLLTKTDPFFSLRDGLKGFSPRVGFAWNTTPGTVLRGGIGFFKEMPLYYIYQLALDAPPYNRRVTVNRPL